MSFFVETFGEGDRRQQIIAAAYDAFCTYGFKRTSMDDIAKGAGISRPALYQTFANKNEIFTAAVELFFERKKQTTEDLFTNVNDPISALTGVIDIAVLEPHRVMAQTPHGQELLGMKTELAPEMFSAWDDHSRANLVRAFELDPKLDAKLIDDLCLMLMTAIGGMKAHQLPLPELERGIKSLINVVQASLK